MNKVLATLMGLILVSGIISAQIPQEQIDKLDQKTLEREFGKFDSSKPVNDLNFGNLPDQTTKSAMADIGNTPAWNWVRSFTGQGGADIRDIVVDGSDVYAYGTFSDSLEIGGTIVVSTGLRDVFIAKIGSFGTLTWLQTLSALPDENVLADLIAVAPDGVVISGELNTGTVTGGGKSATATGEENIFMAHISSAGAVSWIRLYNDLATRKLRVNSDNEIFRLTEFNLQKYDANGDQAWVASVDGAIRDFALYDTSIWVVGGVADSGKMVGDSVHTWDWEMGAFFYAGLDQNGVFNKVEFFPAWVTPQYLDLYLETDSKGALILVGSVGDFFLGDSNVQIWPAPIFVMKVDTGYVEWIRHEEIGGEFYLEKLISPGSDKFYLYAYNYVDSISLGNILIYPDDPNVNFLAEFNSEGEFTNVYEQEDRLYEFAIGTSNTIYTVSYDVYDHWIHKKNFSGAESWIMQIWNNGGDAAMNFTMDIDEDGNLYAQGYYRGTVDFFGNFIKGRGIFIMKFRNDGKVEWFKTMDNPDGFSFGVKVDNDGNVYTWGSFSDYVELEGLKQTNSNKEDTDIYLVKLDRDGQLKFMKQFDGGSTVYGWGGMALTPENDIIISGSFSDTLTLGQYSLISTGEFTWDVFVTKVSSSGKILWARDYGGDGRNWGRTVGTDSAGNVYLSGGFRDSISFDTVSFLHREGAYDLFLTKLDPNGNLVWAKRGGPDNYYLRGHSITTHEDKVYIMGVAWTSPGWMETISFGEETYFSEFQSNNFLASYSTDGVLNWVKIFKINEWSWPVYKLDTDPQGNVYAGGVFQDTIVAGSNLVVGSGAEDFYIMKYNPEGEFQWMKTSESSSRGELDLYSLAVFEEDVVLAGGTLINGKVEIAGEVIKTASQASYAGLLGEDIIGCVMELSVQTTEEDFGQANGSASVTIAGGASPYIYQWSTGDTGIASVDSLLAGTYQVTVMDSKGCEQYSVFSINIKNGPVISLNEIGDVSCNGFADGFINISVTGGTEPYTYYWDNGYSTEDLTNLSAAPFAVTVTDANGLFASAEYIIEEPKTLDVSYNIKQASCGGGADGEIQVFTSGGTKPYDWEWNTAVLTESLIGEEAGKYSLTVLDAKNCRLDIEIALSEKDAPVVETEYIEPATCNMPDGAAKVKVLNAVGNITYSWSDATQSSEITGKRARSYFVDVTNDAGCKTIHLVDIPEKKPIDNQICLVTVDTAVGSNLIVWEKVEDAIQYHVYRETSAKDVYLLAGSTVGADLSVFTDTVANPLIRSYRYKIAAVDECGNESFLSHLHKTVHMTISPGLTSGIMNIRWDDYSGEDFGSFEVWRYTSLYSWELLATLPSTLKSYSDFSVPPGVVFYNVRVPFENPCNPTGNLTTKAGTGPYQHSLSNLDDNKLKESTGIESHMAEQFYVYPNPTAGQVTVWSEAFQITDGEILITDLAGRLFLHEKFEQNLSGRLELDLSSQPAGTYLVQLRMDGQVFYQKLLKQ